MPTTIRPGRPNPALLLPFFTIVAWVALAVPAPASAQETGKVSGKVTEAGSGKPLAFANVVLVGTGTGAISQSDGSFFLAGIPVGSYEIKVSFIGYEAVTKQVEIRQDRTTVVDFELEGSVVEQVERVEVRAERPLVEVEKTSTIRSFDAEELQQLTLEPSLDSVVEQQPGVTRDRGRLHVRGGRTDETTLIVDGVRMKDVLSGTSESNTISARSVAEVDIITGGFDAKYGEALSGVIQTRLKDGTEEWHGSLHYETDHLISNQNTDVAQVQIGGPNLLLDGIRDLFGMKGSRPTFFLDISAELTDTHLPSIGDLDGKRLASSYEESFLGNNFTYGRFFRPRANNFWRGLFKTAWSVGRKDKVTLTLTKSVQFDQGFGEVDIGDIDRNNFTYPWEWSRRLDHYYTFTRDQNSASVSWNHTYGVSTIQTIRLNRFFSSTHSDVAGKHWTEYDNSRDRDLDDPTPFFIDVGDASEFRDRYVETLGLSGDWAWTPGQHKLEWGFNTQYEDVQFLTLDASSVVCDSTGCPAPLGDEFDLFHVFPTTGAFYAQDRMEYEGLIANVGLRYDYWFPGKQVERLVEEGNRPTITPGLRREFEEDTQEIFGRKFKGRISPRIGISYPITRKDNIFFHYGHFTQRPAYFYVYAKSGSQSAEAFPRIGNPNLNPEVSVQYELGVGHTFSEHNAVKLTLFNKDIYDYPTSTTIVIPERTTGRSNFFIYRNLDYARTRGFELELKKGRGSGYWSGSLSYTFSTSKGKSSDPNNLSAVQESGGDARETELEEISLWWNRPHKFTARASLSVYENETPPTVLGFTLPRDFYANAYFLIRSGRAYTPQTPDGRRAGPQYSKNGPYDSELNFTLRKGLSLGGRRFEVFLMGWNLFDHRTAINFDWATGKAWELGEGSLDAPTENPDNLELSDEELVAAAGREVGPDESVEGVAADLRHAIEGNMARYSDPSFLSEPRRFRVGLTMEF